jgi:hypothetical protein
LKKIAKIFGLYYKLVYLCNRFINQEVIFAKKTFKSLVKMEDKKLNNQESLELITMMINKTKRQLHVGEGNLLLWWGYTSAIVGVLVGVSLLLTGGNPICNWLWFLIWIVGGIGMLLIVRKDKSRIEKEPSTYVDRLTGNLWGTIGWLFALGTLMSIGFQFFGKDTWVIMLVFAFLFCGFGTCIQGFILKEKSMVWGGSFSLVAGVFVLCCVISGVELSVQWVIPLFVMSFVATMIIPGHVLNAKAKKQCSAI